VQILPFLDLTPYRKTRSNSSPILKRLGQYHPNMSISTKVFHPTTSWVENTITQQCDGWTKSWISIVINVQWTIPTKLCSHICINGDQVGVRWTWTKYLFVLQNSHKNLRYFLCLYTKFWFKVWNFVDQWKCIVEIAQWNAHAI